MHLSSRLSRVFSALSGLCGLPSLLWPGPLNAASISPPWALSVSAHLYSRLRLMSSSSANCVAGF
ncbi:MAG: hypothetical protein H0W85_03925 [Methylotenera sp.]|nr:hypothetical protein [Methylotenera sp.]